MFGVELKKLVSQKQTVEKIGGWAFSVYFEHLGQLEPGLDQVMLDLTTMEGEPEFAISYKMLNKIADDLIADKDIDLNSAEYREDNG